MLFPNRSPTGNALFIIAAAILFHYLATNFASLFLVGCGIVIGGSAVIYMISSYYYDTIRRLINVEAFSEPIIDMIFDYFKGLVKKRLRSKKKLKPKLNLNGEPIHNMTFDDLMMGAPPPEENEEEIPSERIEIKKMIPPEPKLPEDKAEEVKIEAEPEKKPTTLTDGEEPASSDENEVAVSSPCKNVKLLTPRQEAFALIGKDTNAALALCKKHNLKLEVDFIDGEKLYCVDAKPKIGVLYIALGQSGIIAVWTDSLDTRLTGEYISSILDEDIYDLLGKNYQSRDVDGFRDKYDTIISIVKNDTDESEMNEDNTVYIKITENCAIWKIWSSRWRGGVKVTN